MMKIIITGTPGTGKTSVAKRLSEKLGYEYVNLNDILIRSGVCVYNPELETHEISNIDKAIEIIDDVTSRDNIVIDTLVVSLINPEYIDKVVVLRLDPYILLERLKSRGWRGRKLCENVMAEILDYFLIECVENFGNDKIIEIDTTNRDVENIVDEIIQMLNKNCSRVGVVSWLSKIDPDFLLRLDMCREGVVDIV